MARLGASVVKAIPVFGSLLGGVSMSIMSGASTYAIGQVFNEHFKRGGDLSDLDVEDFKRYYEEKVQEGKKVAEELRKQSEQEAKSKNRTDAMQEKLEELNRLKDKGFVTSEEYEKMREKILKDFIG